MTFKTLVAIGVKMANPFTEEKKFIYLGQSLSSLVCQVTWTLRTFTFVLLSTERV